MSKPADTAPLGEIPPARSRQQGRRSAVAMDGDRAVVGTAAGELLGFDLSAESPSRRWRHDPDGEPSVVAATPTGGETPGWLVGERSARGGIRCHDADGTVRWRYSSSKDVGEPQDETRFLLPFVASLATGADRWYAAARRYERGDDGSRTFRSRVYAFETDGTLAWTYHADASPISISVHGERVAVAYNRCPGDHQQGLVVLNASDGSVRWTWDPDTEGQRRVGDVALLDDGAIATSHGDYCGYRLDAGGRDRWRVPLGTPHDVGDETVYAYPNHVHATPSSAVFVTGNTYPEDGRETEARHPNEHTAVGVSLDGEQRWSSPVGGFASGLSADGDLLAVPGAQHFRDRDAERHGLRLLDVAAGHVDTVDTPGIVTAASVSGETAVAIEEPVVYHDEGVERGAYRLHAIERDAVSTVF